MTVFPSKDWLEKYEKAINESEEYEEAGEGWGVDHDGDFLFIIEDFPIKEISSEELPDSIKDQIDEYLSDGTFYTYVGLKDGNCTGTALLQDPNEKKHGFELRGPYQNWKKLVKGDIGAVRAILSNDLKLDGDMSKIMTYTRAAKVLGNLAKEVPKTVFLDEEYHK